jgi:8-oxo-dGTP pyrophosphatase MutT (NUDIX family)
MNEQVIWKPHVTVASVIERGGRFLMVEEDTDSGVKINQPAGHLEPGESLIEASSRETLEETRHHFVPEWLIGIYRWTGGDTPYLRFAFSGHVTHIEADRSLDKGIRRALWLTLEELEGCAEQHRSPLVLRCVKDYLSGRRIALDALAHYRS